MAKQLFKGFKQVLEGQFTAETGYLYFVRSEANTGKTDGYLLFNERMYGTAAEAAAALEAKIGTLPSGYTDLVSYIDDQVTAITSDYATKEELGTLSGRVDTLEASAATKTEVGTLSGRVDTLEAISADTRLTELEASAHTHSNKSVLDGISAEDVTAWDAAENNAIGAASAYTDSKYDSAVTASAVVLSAFTGESATSGYLKTYEIYQGGSSIGKIDIPKDMVVSSGGVVEEGGVKYVRLYIANTDPQQSVDIAVSDLAHVYTEGSGITISNDDKITAKVKAENGLSVDGTDGIQLALADANSGGAMSNTDFVKLGTIEASAQTNVIEEVKVDGTALTVDNKSVNIVLSGLATNNTVGALSARVDILEVSAATKNEVGTLSGRVDTIEADYLKAEDITALTANITALSAVSADSRIAALEAISGETHTHDNKDVLDAITSADTAAWDSALQSVSAADNSVTVGSKDVNGNQTIQVKISSDSNNGLSLESDGLFAGIYYDGNDTEE